MPYLLDTNIFNWLIDQRIERTDLPSDGEFLITHVQVDEVNDTSDSERRARITLTLVSLHLDLVPTETTVLDYSRLDHCKLGDGVVYSALLTDLNTLNGGKPSNIKDALTAEVAIRNNHTLLTADQDLAHVTRVHGGTVRLYTEKAQ